MTTIKDYIIQRLAVARATRKAQHTAEISARFRIAERGGKIYLLCYGTAIAVISGGDTAYEISKLIYKARAAAILYDSAAATQPHTSYSHDTDNK